MPNLQSCCVKFQFVLLQIATVVSIRGCKVHARKPIHQTGEKDKFLKKDSEDRRPDEKLGFLENLLQIIYQVSLICMPMVFAYTNKYIGAN